MGIIYPADKFLEMEHRLELYWMSVGALYM